MPKRYRRREVVKSLSIAATGTTIVGQTAAERSTKDIYKHAVKIREQTGEYESFEKYLLNHGFELKQQNSEIFPFTEQTGADDELTTNRIEKSDMTLTATVYTSGDNSIASGGWNVDPDTGTAYDTDITDNGHAPADVVGIGWEHSDYDLEWDSWDGTKWTYDPDPTTNNISWRADDLHSPEEWAGCVSVILNPTEDISERSIIVSYMHTWRGGHIDSVGFGSSGGMSVDVSLKANSWNTAKKAHSDDS